MNGVSTPDGGLLPKWARYAGWILLAGQMPFICRIVFESTVLTCREGPQMVGFSLFHGGHSFFLVGLLFPPFALIWLIGAVIRGSLKRLRFSWDEWILVVAVVASFALLFVPYPAWQHFDVAVCGPGPYGSAFLLDAAAYGDLSLVKSLLAKGYGTNQESGGGSTPLSAAIVGNQQKVAEFLISRGANINQHIGLSGETPLIVAAEMGHMDTLKLLLAHGAEPCAVDREQENAQAIALRHHHQDIADYLIATFHCPPPPPPSCDESPNNCVVVH